MARIRKYFRVLSHISCLIFFTFFLTKSSRNPILKRKMSRYLPDLKYLLVWSKLPYIEAQGQRHFIDKKCYVYNCYLTTNRSLFGDLRYFDGIIFNLQDVSRGHQELPRVRNPIQKYIFAANDSADSYPVCDPIYDNFFNWTWTYRSDSTIPYRFITIFNTDNQELGSHFDWAPMKTKKEATKDEIASKYKAAAIFLDKCQSRSKREVFLKNLQNKLAKYNLTVDVFGKCGTMECRRKTMKPCFWKLKKYYYFYLAFEDSFAVDYVTKTVLYAYQNNAIPIVYGKADYNKYLPPESYIDAFALGEEKLALTMYQVVFDSHRYLQFFKWRDYYSLKESQVLDACSLCTALNNPNWLIHHATYTDFRKWWNDDFQNRCSEYVEDNVAKYFTF